MAKSEAQKNDKNEKITTSKTKATQKATTKKAGTNKTTSKKKTATLKNLGNAKKPRKKALTNIIEYYDLPDNYNQTTVKLLFQTPKKLFVYWEIAEIDKLKYLQEQGQDFFEKTSPFLLVKNKTKSYSFEVEINDYANSWYFDVPDSNCDYEVELIRKHNQTKTPTLITTSNKMEVPNNRILFEQNRKEIFYKNVKTNDVISKSVVNLQFINHLGNAYNANSFYKKFFYEEDVVLDNPTSG